MAEAEKPEKTEESKTEEKPTPKEVTAVTHHSIKVDGKALAYTVTAGTLILKEEDQEKGEKPKASVFYVAYMLDGVDDPAQRPITSIGRAGRFWRPLRE